jgi:hypothetical protein
MSDHEEYAEFVRAPAANDSYFAGFVCQGWTVIADDGGYSCGLFRTEAAAQEYAEKVGAMWRRVQIAEVWHGRHRTIGPIDE